MACEAPIERIRALNPLAQITEDEICAYYDMALDALVEYDIIAGKEEKARAYMTLKLLGQLLWHRVQERVNEYDETLETFKDVNKWMNYWQDRIEELIHTEDDSEVDEDEELTSAKIGNLRFGVI